MSKFFPFWTAACGEGVTILEYGLPKTGQAERELLLNESDEDEV